jgi:SOS-response transcriptional repressor LexA
MPETIQPTKKQRELLNFVEDFIESHGYSPSYREIMEGLNYTSVATVSLHINNLIIRGYLAKRNRSARSLFLVKPNLRTSSVKTNLIKPEEEKWLVKKVEYYFEKLETNSVVEQAPLDELYVLVGALNVLGLSGAAQSFMPRLSELKGKVSKL